MFFSKSKPNACKSKRRFKTDAEAHRALRSINPTLAPNKPKRVYRCPDCQGYHLSSKPKLG